MWPNMEEGWDLQLSVTPSRLPLEAKKCGVSATVVIQGFIYNLLKQLTGGR